VSLGHDKAFVQQYPAFFSFELGQKVLPEHLVKQSLTVVISVF
jgi:hypothetical protein